MSKISLSALSAKIAALQAQYDERIAAGEQPAAPALTPADLPEGTLVSFTVPGPNGTTQELSGKVLGVKTGDKGGTVVTVFTGSGAEARIVKPFISKVRVITPEEGEVV